MCYAIKIIGCLMLLTAVGGCAFSNTAAEPWGWLGFAGFVLLGFFGGCGCCECKCCNQRCKENESTSNE